MSVTLIAGLGNPGREYAGTRHNLGFTAVSVIISMFLLFGSIGLLNLKPWARTMMLVFGGVDLIYDIAKLIFTFAILPTMVKLFETYPPPNFPPQAITWMRLTTLITAGVVFAITAGYSVSLLLILNRPNVKEALAPVTVDSLPM